MLVGGLGLRIYELTDDDGIHYPDAEVPFCKRCTEDWVEQCKVAEYRGQGQVIEWRTNNSNDDGVGWAEGTLLNMRCELIDVGVCVPNGNDDKLGCANGFTN